MTQYVDDYVTQWHKGRITAAFEFFGPDVIARGMQVYEEHPNQPHFHSRGHNVMRCFVAFMGATRVERFFHVYSPGYYRMLRLNDPLASMLMSRYEDDAEYQTHDNLYNLAVEWLESQPVAKRGPNVERALAKREPVPA